MGKREPSSFQAWNERKQMNKFTPKISNKSYVQGSIDEINGRLINGWIACVAEETLPILFVNGRPAKLTEWPVPRRDVNSVLGLPGNLGFTFLAQGVAKDDLITLYLFDGKKSHFVCEQRAKTGTSNDDLFLQIRAAKEISLNPNSVAITCWDGAHNPLGRAHVLYEVASVQRPTVLISYLFDEFGGEVWKPLRETNLNSIMIPWKRRHEAFDMMAQVDLSFSTIWLCKSRQPTFDLASNLMNEKTRLILDHDDNEVAFAESSEKDSVFGRNSVSLARNLQSKITAHTAASATLASELDAKLVRHVRQPVDNPTPRQTAQTDTLKIGFVGTVRPHKGLIEAARAIKLTSRWLKRKIEFHVYGIFDPASFFDELQALGVIVKQSIKQDDLKNCLQEFDVILTGFGAPDNQHSDITRYQISSKIGDALAVGRPALIPASESVADLEDCPGAFLFTPDTFSTALVAAIDMAEPVTLPESFTPKGGYKAFKKAEKQASVPTFEMVSLRSSMLPIRPRPVPTLLLIWKQSDSGIFGRRVDQIARAYKYSFPDHRVVILELQNQYDRSRIEEYANEFSHEAKLIVPLMDAKAARTHTDKFGVEHHGVVFPNSHGIKDAMTSYLISEALQPENTNIVLFPVALGLEQIYDILAGYRCIVDVVDNQFAWATPEGRLKLGGQYHALLKMADRLVLNTPETLNFLNESGFLTEEQCEQPFSRVIPNWYEDNHLEVVRKNSNNECHLVYSGNLNDRIDWRLIADIADLDPSVTVHLVGAAGRAEAKIAEVMSNKNVVYWGPMTESRVSELLLNARAGLMPHVTDNVSTYMNPIKVQMYRAHGLPVISTDVPGIDPNEVILCDSRHAFLDAVSQIIEHPLEAKDRQALQIDASKAAAERIQLYIDMLEEL